MRILLVDDHLPVREGIKAMLSRDPQLQVVGDCGDAEEALRMVALTSCDVVVLDLSLPGRGGLWFLEQMREQAPDVAVLVLTMHADADNVAAALRLGAQGYLLKSCTRDEMLYAVQQVYQGSRYLHPPVTATFLNRLHTPELSSGPHLTERETRILSLLQQGMSNGQIAEQLHVSLSTIKACLTSLYQKFNVNDRTHLVAVTLEKRRP